MGIISVADLNDVSNQRDYFIDVRLFTYSAASYKPTNAPKDFTGINTLSVDYLKENVGFGITDIDISINASLQPIVEITFKDLYGNTVFTRNNNNEASGMYRDLFDWPPPKFDLIYKGYLGKTTRLMLNLKKTDIEYNSSDGSFTIKCSFVPNIWGPFADIPTLFLYAVKKLQVDENPENPENVITFFDLIKIGRKVDTIRKSFNNQFVDLVDKLNQTRASLYAAFTTGAINPPLKILGSIPAKGGTIEGFSNITVYDYKKKDNFQSKEDIVSSGVDPGVLSDYFLSKTQIDGTSDYTQPLSQFLQDRTGTTKQGTTTVVDIINSKRTIIDKNLQLVSDYINAETFTENQSLISATTISQIFSKLGGDTGYILGKILQAGLLGYEWNKGAREGDKKHLIGRYYPLMIKAKSKNDKSIPIENAQVVADDVFFQNKTPYDKSPTNEIKFVENFIQAIAFGLGDAAAIEEQLDSKGRNKLIKRISNLEVLQPNPYSASYNSIIENMVVRSGIWGHFTNSPDPNTPGDYYQVTSFNRGEPSKSAKAEVENITEALIKQIPDLELKKIRNACLYFKEAFNPDNSVPQKDTKITVKGSGDFNFLNFTNGINFQQLGIPADFSASNNVLNNGLSWFNKNIKGKYRYVVFESREQVEFIRSVNSSDTDSKYKNSDEQDNSSTLLVGSRKEPPGLIIIDEFVASGGTFEKNPPGAGKIDYFNDFYNNEQLLSYNSLLSNMSLFFAEKSADISQFPDKYNFKPNDVDKYPIKRETSSFLPIAYAIYSANESNENAWDLFGDTDEAGKQRYFLYNLAVELLTKLDKVSDEKKLQIATIEGKANESKDSIYLQMHHIFYQWASLIFNYTKEDIGTNQQELYDFLSLPQKLEEIYSTISTAKSTENKGFQYIAPLIKYKNAPIDVENSVINLDSCYNIDANSSVLNIIQNVCNKNNFLFFPLPGGNYDDIDSLFKPEAVTQVPIPGNKFVVLWSPTPESRAFDNDGNDLGFIQDKDKIETEFFLVQFGSTDNAVFRNVRVSTDSTRPTAESIVNLQRIVDKQVDNKIVTEDCSTIPLFEGRSYTSEIETLGNAQIQPLQFYYLDKMPIFGGLYQTMEVHHHITPNNFETKFKGMKMRYNAGKFGGVPPVTLKTLADLAGTLHLTTGSTHTSNYTPKENYNKYISSGKQNTVNNQSSCPSTPPTYANPSALSINSSQIYKNKKIYNAFIDNGLINSSGNLTAKGVLAAAISINEGINSLNSIQYNNLNPGNIRGSNGLNGFARYNSWNEGYAALLNNYINGWIINKNMPAFLGCTKLINCFIDADNAFFSNYSVPYDIKTSYSFTAKTVPSLRQFFSQYAPVTDSNNPALYAARVLNTLKANGIQVRSIDQPITDFLS